MTRTFGPGTPCSRAERPWRCFQIFVERTRRTRRTSVEPVLSIRTSLWGRDGGSIVTAWFSSKKVRWSELLRQTRQRDRVAVLLHQVYSSSILVVPVCVLMIARRRSVSSRSTRFMLASMKWGTIWLLINSYLYRADDLGLKSGAADQGWLWLQLLKTFMWLPGGLAVGFVAGKRAPGIVAASSPVSLLLVLASGEPDSDLLVLLRRLL